MCSYIENRWSVPPWNERAYVGPWPWATFGCVCVPFMDRELSRFVLCGFGAVRPKGLCQYSSFCSSRASLRLGSRFMASSPRSSGDPRRPSTFLRRKPEPPRRLNAFLRCPKPFLQGVAMPLWAALIFQSHSSCISLYHLSAAH